MRRWVADAVFAKRDIHGSGIKRRYINLVHQSVTPRRPRHIAPVPATVARELNETVVRAHIDGIRVVRRFLNRDDSRVHFTTSTFVGDRGATPTLARFVIACEIRRDGCPAVAAIRGLEQHVATLIHHLVCVE